MANAEQEKEKPMIRDLINTLNSGFKQLDRNGWTFYDFVLRNGREFTGQPLPGRYKLRQPQLCYANTYDVVRRAKGLRYCEGYVACTDLLFVPIQHAWAINARDEVIDTTLQNWDGSSRAGLAHYLGIVVEPSQLERKRKWCGVLMDEYGTPNLDFWFSIDPGFKELIDQTQKLHTTI